MPISWSNQSRRLGDLIPWERNPRQIRTANAARLRSSLEEFGQAELVVIGPANQVYNGHQRLRVWGEQFGPDIMVDVRVSSRELTEREREKLTVYLHKGATGDWDFDMLANEFDLGDLLDWGFGAVDLGLGADFETGSPADDEGEAEEAEQRTLTRDDVPDAIFPSDNDWGIPALKLTQQAQFLDAPVAAWGAMPRSHRYGSGTIHFYVDDYRFSALWADPSPVVNAAVVNVVEPNFSVFRQMPRAGALWQVFRKRWLARYWQESGLRVFVDLNVPPWAQEFNLLGVPQGWRAYATRGAIGATDETMAELELARAHAGTDDVLFVVYGGSVKLKTWCQQQGLVWVAEDSTAARMTKAGVHNGQQ